MSNIALKLERPHVTELLTKYINRKLVKTSLVIVTMCIVQSFTQCIFLEKTSNLNGL
jgi:hypothetical protein